MIRKLMIILQVIMITCCLITATSAQSPKETQVPASQDEITEDFKEAVKGFSKSMQSQQKGRVLIGNEGPRPTPGQVLEKIRQGVEAEQRNARAREQEGAHLWLWVGLLSLTIFLLSAVFMVAIFQFRRKIKNLETGYGRLQDTVGRLREVAENEPLLDEDPSSG